MALSFTAVSSRQKAENISDAMLVAEQQLALAVKSTKSLSQTQHAAFWDASLTDPYSEGTVTMGGTDYNFKIEAQSVATGTAPNRLRKLDLTVWWWSDGAGASRPGHGKLQYSISRLVREVVYESP